MAVWTTAYINNLPDSSFLYIEPGGSKDAEGKTTPRSLRHFPVKDASGAVDMPHLRNALSRIPQSSLSPAVKARCISKAQGMMPSDSSARTEGEPFEVVQLIERDGEAPRLVGKFAIFDRWQEINNAAEGHFLERINFGAFKKTIRENNAIKVLLSHGKDPSLGMTVLGKINALREQPDGATYDVSLFRGVPQLLVDGLRAGVYGASFRGEAIKNDVTYRPQRSDYNPDGLPEVSRQEIALKDIGPTPFPQYAEATAVMRMEDFEDYLKNRQLIERDLFDHGAVALEREEPEPEEEPDEATTPEDEPQHSAEQDVNREKEEIPSWQLRR